jgi:hypothetical protein
MAKKRARTKANEETGKSALNVGLEPLSTKKNTRVEVPNA